MQKKVVASPDLPSLLWTALHGLERTYIREGAGSHTMPSLDQWANLLRALTGKGLDCRELPTLLRLSKRAVRSRISSAVRQGWVEKLKFGRGQAAVRLTVHGSEVAARWKALEVAAEERWRADIGADRARKLRDSLEKVVSAIPLEHPHYPASYGAADARITGGNGLDWKEVPRKAGDTTSGLPLTALISEALVAFAMNYEDKSPVALSLSAGVIKRIPDEGRPLRGLGHSAGISALHRHGFLRMRGNNASAVVFLTPKGSVVKEAYDDRLEAVETEWRNRFGDGPVTAMRRALQDVAEVAGSYV